MINDKLNSALLVVGAVAGAAALFTAAFSLRLKKRTYKLYSKKVGDRLRIAQVSDLHDCLFGDGQHNLTAMLSACEPDLIFLTGDIIEDNTDYAAAPTVLVPGHPARQMIEAAVKIAPVYMVLGNHEANIPHPDSLRRELNALGVTLVENHSVRVATKAGNLLICGMEDPYFLTSEEIEPPRDKDGSFLMRICGRLGDDYNRTSRRAAVWRDDQSKLFSAITREKALTLLLSHRPEEYRLYDALGFDAAFSGHAHGGQWRLPFLINGLYAPHQGFFPRHAGGCYRYPKADGEFVHVVSRGLSTKRFPRIFNRPEVCVLDILPIKG